MRDELKRILCVEDDPDIQLLVRVALGRVGGFDVELCSSGAEAVACVERFSPDLILLDVMMPGMDGPATLVELRKTDAARDTPVVFLTGKGKSTEISHLRDLGAAGVIPKPFDPMVLARNVRAIWAETRGA